MRKFLAAALAAITLSGSITSVTVAPAEAHHRDLFFHKRGGSFGGVNQFYHRGYFYNGASRFQDGHRFYGYNRGYRGDRFYGGGPRYYGYNGGHRYYDYYGYDDGYDDSGIVAAGIIGLAASAILSGALNHHHSYSGPCEARFRSYHRASGTYLGHDGRRHFCR